MTNISSSYFYWNKDTKNFSAEASELPKNFSLRKIYDDACDVGFSMVSTRTGRSVKFRLEKEIKNEGDVLSWEFKCIDQDHKDIGVVIFND
jgi:hypothetical protein